LCGGFPLPGDAPLRDAFEELQGFHASALKGVEVPFLPLDCPKPVSSKVPAG
jgi:hypothetical protein